MLGLGLVTGLIAAGIAYAVSTVMPPVYEARAVVFVGSDYDPVSIQVSQDMASRYAGLASTAKILDPVVARLGLEDSVAELRDRIAVRAPENLSSIDIVAAAPTAAESAALANAIADQIVRFATPSTPPGGEASPSHAEIAERALAPESPTSPRVLINTLLGGILGFVLGMGIGWLFTTRPGEV
jgi:capsular polysaccharide biosynthesis protein